MGGENTGQCPLGLALPNIAATNATAGSFSPPSPPLAAFTEVNECGFIFVLVCCIRGEIQPPPIHLSVYARRNAQRLFHPRCELDANTPFTKRHQLPSEASAIFFVDSDKIGTIVVLVGGHNI
mmetsp:Transcript_35520/g.68428  ORF Transcript_35520/g.68428 Transcript_35520/m.68428 type:complete len:123 (-) Transcript_35520:726-1094(-)